MPQNALNSDIKIFHFSAKIFPRKRCKYDVKQPNVLLHRGASMGEIENLALAVPFTYCSILVKFFSVLFQFDFLSSS